MKTIKALTLDLALTHAGMALIELPLKADIQTSDVKVCSTFLAKTERQKTKQVFQNSDDLRRLKEIYSHVKRLLQEADIVFAEIPSGAQSARAALTFGAVLGMLSTIDKPLIQVQKTDRGMVVANRKSVSKQEVIDWAVKNWPDAGWHTVKRKSVLHVTNDNEHVADSLAIAVAGTRNDQWKNLAGMSSLGQNHD